MEDAVVDRVHPMKPLADIARWILFIPVGLFAALLANAAFVLSLAFGAWILGNNPDAPYIELAAAFAGGVFGVMAGTWMAPSPRIWPGILVAGVIIFLSLLLAAGLAAMGEWVWWDQIKNMLMIVGSIVGMIWATEQRR